MSEDASRLSPGTVLAGKYRIERVLGQGGFGKVRRVEKDGVMYAMKEMLKARVMAKKSVESVMKELELTSLKDRWVHVQARGAPP